MTKEDNDNIQDVDYEEIKEKDTDKVIRGKALYYSTSQVANLLGIPDSKVRYYSVAFDDILHIEVSNKQRRYTEKDIDKMKFLVELKNEGMTIKQIQEYCQEVDFESENGIQVKESNPLSIKTLAKALLEEQSKQLNLFKEEMKEFVSNKLDEQILNIKNNNDLLKESLLEEVSLTIDNIIDEKLSENLDKQEQRIIKHEAEVSRILRESMNEKKILSQEQENQKKKGFFDRLFNR